MFLSIFDSGLFSGDLNPQQHEPPATCSLGMHIRSHNSWDLNFLAFYPYLNNLDFWLATAILFFLRVYSSQDFSLFCTLCKNCNKMQMHNSIVQKFSAHEECIKVDSHTKIAKNLMNIHNIMDIYLHKNPNMATG